MARAPRRADLARAAWMGGAVALVFVVVFGGTDHLTALHDVRLHVHLPFEPRIPLVPEAAAVYLSIAAMFALAPFVLRGWRDLLPLAVTLVAQILVAGVLFVLLPIELGYRDAPAGSGLTWSLLGLADRMNLDHNLLPSLHVAFAVTMGEVYGARAGPWGRLGLRLWAAGIAASAVLIHAHHLADVVAGALLAFAGLRLIHRWASAPSFLDAVQVEWTCLREFSWFVRRHVRYGLLFVTMYGRCLTSWRTTRAVRAGYCLLQHLDDVADGDRSVGTEAAAYLRTVLAEIESGRFARGSTASVLAASVVPELRARSSDGVDLVRVLGDLVRVLLFDRERVERRLLLREPELRAHHRRTFELSLALLLGTSGSDITVGEVPALVDALAWCSPMRDLEEDWRKGLVNVPREVLEADGWSESRLPAYSELVARPNVGRWIERELQAGVAALDAFDRALPALSGRRGAADVGRLQRALRHFARRYARGRTCS